MGIRDWLAIIVIIFIVLILLDGFRRKWLERKNRIVMKLDKNIPPPNDEDEVDPLTKSELPAGGARIKHRADRLTAQENGIGDDVPVLMESVDINDEEIEEYPVDLEELEDQEMLDESNHIDEVIEEEEEDATEYMDEADDEEVTASRKEDAEAALADENSGDRNLPRGRGKPEDRIEPIFGDEELTFGHDDQGELDLEHNELIDTEGSDDGEEEGDEQHLAEEVIIINVMAKKETLIEGKSLLPVLLRHGMRLGEMSIFHRHADSDGKGPVMFSMANMLKPGTFSMSEMEEFTTPGVCFFMQLPNKLGNMQCFEQMLKTAEAVKDGLDAVLKDEDRSVFTRQTIEHSRQRIQDFELEMLARK